MKLNKGEHLIQQLMDDPIDFSGKGMPYQLLQEYFKGMPLDTLIPMLHSENEYVQSAATFIISELGKQGCVLIDEIIPLLNSKNLNVRYDALESVAVCASGDQAANYVHVLESLHDEVKQIRLLAMKLIANADLKQLRDVKSILAVPSEFSKIHKKGFELITLEECINGCNEQIIMMLDSIDPMERKYGAIASIRFYHMSPSLIQIAINHNDEDVSMFSRQFLEVQAAKQNKG